MHYLGLVAITLFMVGLIALIVWSHHTDKKKAAARAELAALRGWTYTGGGGGRRRYLLQGPCEGGPWSLEVRRGGKNNPGHSMFICSGAPAPGGVVYVGAPGLGAFLQSGVGRKLTQWGLHLGQALGASTQALERLLENPVAVDLSGTAFGERHSVLATDTSLAHRLLTDRAKEALLTWTPKGRFGRSRGRGLTVTWSEEGLNLSWPADQDDADDMASFAELGILLVREVLRQGTW